jgi:hypothetical protein
MKGSMTQFNRPSANVYRQLNDRLYSDGYNVFTWSLDGGKRYLTAYECEMRRVNDILKYGECRVRVKAKTEKI